MTPYERALVGLAVWLAAFFWIGWKARGWFDRRRARATITNESGHPWAGTINGVFVSVPPGRTVTVHGNRVSEATPATMEEKCP